MCILTDESGQCKRWRLRHLKIPGNWKSKIEGFLSKKRWCLRVKSWHLLLWVLTCVGCWQSDATCWGEDGKSGRPRSWPAAGLSAPRQAPLGPPRGGGTRKRSSPGRPTALRWQGLACAGCPGARDRVRSQRHGAIPVLCGAGGHGIHDRHNGDGPTAHSGDRCESHWNVSIASFC